MYYKEDVINGVLCFKNTPSGEWHKFTDIQLTHKLMKLRAELNKIHNLNL